MEMVPTTGKWFYVDPQAIDQRLFMKMREDWRQERTRKLILEAFEELKNNPEKYGRRFETMMPKKNWNTKTVAELRKLACQLGDHNANWIEQALEWAQRICNGESWEAICNYRDRSDWYRLVVWKEGYIRIVGGSSNAGDDSPASEYDINYYKSSASLPSTVPLVVRYEK